MNQILRYQLIASAATNTRQNCAFLTFPSRPCPCSGSLFSFAFSFLSHGFTYEHRWRVAIAHQQACKPPPVRVLPQHELHKQTDETVQPQCREAGECHGLGEHRTSAALFHKDGDCSGEEVRAQSLVRVLACQLNAQPVEQAQQRHGASDRRSHREDHKALA